MKSLQETMEGANHLYKKSFNFFSDCKNKSSQEKILLVDDTIYNIFVLKELLSDISSDLHIDTAMNGKLALEKI